MPKISIIIPVYNTELYLKKCLDSIISQTYQDYEVIIVNDGSTDNSQNIISEYEKKYKDKIFAYYKENEGVSIARNFGIEKSKGEFITFVDSDDYIDKYMLEKMIKKANEDNFDMIICNLLYIYPNKKVIGKSNIKGDLLTKDQIKNNIINILPAMCGKLIKRNLYTNFKFKPNIWYEDVESYFRMYPKLNKIGYINQDLYFYPQRNDSITYTYNEKLYDIIYMWDGIIKEYKKNNYFDEYKSELEISVIRYSFATFVKRLAKTKNKKMFKLGVDKAIENVNNLFPNYKNNIYLKTFSIKNIYLKYFNKSFACILFHLINGISIKKNNKIIILRGKNND